MRKRKPLFFIHRTQAHIPRFGTRCTHLQLFTGGGGSVLSASISETNRLIRFCISWKQIHAPGREMYFETDALSRQWNGLCCEVRDARLWFTCQVWSIIRCDYQPFFHQRRWISAESCSVTRKRTTNGPFRTEQACWHLFRQITANLLSVFFPDHCTLDQVSYIRSRHSTERVPSTQSLNFPNQVQRICWLLFCRGSPKHIILCTFLIDDTSLCLSLQTASQR